MIRRHRGMRFLGGHYAYPGGKVDASDAAPESLARTIGLSLEAAEQLFPGVDGLPALAYWVSALRELFEETGILMASDEAGHPLDLGDPDQASRVERCRKALMGGEQSLARLLAGEGWLFDLRPLRYLCHFMTPRSSPIRFTARFFLSPLPQGQEPRLFHEETSEGLWLGPADGYRRYRAGEMAMAEPGEYGLGYLAQFDSYDAVWANHADGRHKFEGTTDRIEFYSEGYDWATSSWTAGKPVWHP